MPKLVSLLLAVLIVVAACAGPGASSPTPAVIGPAATPGPPDPTHVPGASAMAGGDALVVFETRGGMCAKGPCGMKAVIHGDGTVERSDGMAQRLDDATLAHLVAVIGQADWEAILAVPFTGECPVNVDGQEEIYTFTAKGQAIAVASCTTQVDATSEPFVTVQGILFAVGG